MMYGSALALSILLVSCKKNNVQPAGVSDPGMEYVHVKNGMLSFKSIDVYNEFLAKDAAYVAKVLSALEKRNDFTSLSESGRMKAGNEIYTELISALLNEDNMVHIEGRIYKVNAESGFVYSISAEYMNDVKFMTALKNEDASSGLIKQSSVEEDLSEISGTMTDKAGPGSGCPTISTSTIIDSGQVTGSYTILPGCTIGNSAASVVLWNYMRYYRYGVLFELVMRGKETDLPSLSPQSGQSCNSITVHSLELAFRRNQNATPYYWSPETRTGNGEVVYKPYSGGNRLCWFIWKGKTSRPSIGLETPVAMIYWNYTL